MVDATRLHVGDKVIVSPSVNFNGSAKTQWIGSTMTIREIVYNNISGQYELRMVEDQNQATGNGWCWREHQLDEYHGSDLGVDRWDLQAGVKVLLKKKSPDDNASRLRFYGKYATIRALSLNHEFFRIKEDYSDNIWSWLNVACIADSNNGELTADVGGFMNFLESVVGNDD